MTTQLSVTIIRGTKLINVELMGGGASDPFVVMKMAGHEVVKTEVIENNLNPEWNCTKEFEWNGESELVFEVFDRNTFRSDKPMGTASLSGDHIPAGFSGELTLMCGTKEAGTLTIDIPKTSSIVEDVVGTVAQGLAEAVTEAVTAITHPSSAAAQAGGVTDSKSGPTETGRVPSISELMESDLLMWKRPVVSGAVLVFLVVLSVAYLFFELRPLSLATNVGLLLIGMGGVVKLAKGQTGAHGHFERISEKSVKPAAESTAQALTRAACFVQHVVLWQEQSHTVKALMALYLLSGISKWLPFSFLAFLFPILFVLPVALKRNETFIKEKCQPQIEMVQKKMDVLLAKIPKYSEIASKSD